MILTKRGVVAAIVLWCALCVGMVAVTAHEQRAPPCDRTDTVLAGLLSQFGEIPIFEGLAVTGAPIVFTANPRSGTWTLLARNGPELLCYLLIGEAWHPVPAPVPKIKPKGSSI